MATPPDFQAALDAVDTATTTLGGHVATLSTAVDGVSTRVAAIVAKLNTSMTADEVATAKAKLTEETTKLDTVSTGLDAIGTALNGIAVDTSNPVPSVPPAPVV